MSSKLFVGSLSWNTTSEDLRSAFEKFGDITECNVVTDRETGRSRGFGFVTYSDADQAKSALDAMNGADLDGRTLRVDSANERRPRSGGGGGGRGGDRGGRW